MPLLRGAALIPRLIRLAVVGGAFDELQPVTVLLLLTAIPGGHRAVVTHHPGPDLAGGALGVEQHKLVSMVHRLPPPI